MPFGQFSTREIFDLLKDAPVGSINRATISPSRPLAMPEGVYDEEEMMREPGHTHYRLLAFLSLAHTGKIIEVGTYRGASSWCLSFNPLNTVITVDSSATLGAADRPKYKRDNVTQIVGDWREVFAEHAAETGLIFVDAAHNGVLEREIYCWLNAQQWKGITLWDDIHFNDPMRDFWQWVSSKENTGKAVADISHIGHGNPKYGPKGPGTGMILFT